MSARPHLFSCPTYIGAIEQGLQLVHFHGHHDVAVLVAFTDPSTQLNTLRVKSPGNFYRFLDLEAPLTVFVLLVLKISVLNTCYYSRQETILGGDHLMRACPGTSCWVWYYLERLSLTE